MFGNAYLKYYCLIALLPVSTMLVAQAFEEKAAALGIDHISYDPYMMAGGLAVIDVNNDGFEDLYFVGGEYPDHLYLNRGDGSFEDATKQLRLDGLGNRNTVGVVAGDLDNDGYTDLFVTTHAGDHNIYLHNEGGEYFTDKSLSASIREKDWSTTATLGDPDLDGDLDIYVGNYVQYSALPFTDNIVKASPNFYYENLGDSRFQLRNDLFQSGEDGCTLVTCFSDIDLDGAPDLFVLNDFGDFYTGNEIYRNQAQGMLFQEQAKELRLNAEINSMGIAIGDVNEDGYLDYYITNIGFNLMYSGSESGAFKFTPSLRINDGSGFSWGAVFTDINNDSYLDLYVAKGSILGNEDPQENRMYVYNENIRNFQDVSPDWQMNDPNRGRGVVYADFNNDGLMDIAVNTIRIKEENPGKPLIFINKDTSNNHYIKIKLEGVESNRSAYGTYLELFAGGRRWMREINGGSSYLSHNSPIVHVGLAEYEMIDSLVVHWSGGTTQSLTNILADQFYYLKEGMDLAPYLEELSTSTTNLFPTNDSSFDFNISPNPASNHVTIQPLTMITEPFKITLIDIMGCVQFRESRNRQTNENTILSFSLSNLSNGIYFIKLENHQFSISKKLIKH